MVVSSVAHPVPSIKHQPYVVVFVKKILVRRRFSSKFYKPWVCYTKKKKKKKRKEIKAISRIYKCYRFYSFFWLIPVRVHMNLGAIFTLVLCPKTNCLVFRELLLLTTLLTTQSHFFAINVDDQRSLYWPQPREASRNPIGSLECMESWLPEKKATFLV